MTGPIYYHEKTFMPYREKLLAAGGKLVEYQSHEMINPLGEECTDIHYICEGVVALGILDDRGNANLLCFFGPGGMYPAYSSTKYHYTIERDACFVKAMSPVKAIKLSQDALSQVMRENSELPFLMLEYFSDMLELFCFEISNKSYNSVFTNTCTFLWVYHRHLRAEGLSMAQEDIAQAVGCTRVALASVLKTLRDQNVITTDRKEITVIDENKLRRFCSREALNDVAL